ncbi:hypothetical protein [Corallococcus silvisoli]|uniref:hypothetical protein n=1 Tax=Corallococcus silvisoli TaxID=2697031 RepID=UPI0013775701|nr:hypothetical protein [Corallococcus silvisoli]NBD11453.1 hypothetical protein [Corallococcus silvisoli]
MCNHTRLGADGRPLSGFDTRLDPDTTRATVKVDGPLSTQQTANCVVVNQWGATLTNVTLRHRYSNNPNYQQQTTWGSIAQNATSSPPLQVIYWTGAVGHDYWWIQFEDDAGKIWTCKQNFYCTLSTADANTTVYFFVNGASEEMRVQATSTSCDVSLYES